MSWSFSGFRGSANNKVSGAVLAVNPTQTIPVGAVVRAVCSSDNISTGGGQTSDHVVTDFNGNIWTKLREQSNTAAAAAGITGSEWISQLVTALTISDSVVLGIRSAATSKAIGLYEYAIGAGNLVRIVSGSSSEQDATNAPTVTLSGLDSAAYALIGSVHREDDTAGTYVMDADYNDRTKFGTTGGTAATNVSCIVGDRLATLTGDTFSPTSLSTAADVVTILCALQEIVPFSLTCSKVVKSGGRVYVTWSNGVQDEFSSIEDATAMRDELYANGEAIARRMAIARYLRADPMASNPSLLEGHTIKYTDAINSMVTVI